MLQWVEVSDQNDSIQMSCSKNYALTALVLLRSLNWIAIVVRFSHAPGSTLVMSQMNSLIVLPQGAPCRKTWGMWQWNGRTMASKVLAPPVLCPKHRGTYLHLDNVHSIHSLQPGEGGMKRWEMQHHQKLLNQSELLTLWAKETVSVTTTWLHR